MKSKKTRDYKTGISILPLDVQQRNNNDIYNSQLINKDQQIF